MTGTGEHGIGQPGLLPVSKGDKLTIAGTDGNYPNNSDARRLSMLRFFPIKKHGIAGNGIIGSFEVDYENIIHPGKFSSIWNEGFTTDGLSGGSYWWIPENTVISNGINGGAYCHTPKYLPNEGQPEYETFYEWTVPYNGIWHLQLDAGQCRGSHGIYVNYKLVYIIGNDQADDDAASIILNKNDKVILINLTFAESGVTINAAAAEDLNKLKNSQWWDRVTPYNYFGTAGTGYGPRLWLNNFYPFKVQPQELVLGTIDYEHGQSWFSPNGNGGFEFDSEKEFPSDRIYNFIISLGRRGSLWDIKKR